MYVCIKFFLIPAKKRFYRRVKWAGQVGSILGTEKTYTILIGKPKCKMLLDDFFLSRDNYLTLIAIPSLSCL
jgi:hypothetical protein